MGKGQKKGFLLPPAVGYSFRVLFYLFGNHAISFRFLIRTLLTLLINIINWPFRTYEKLFINEKYSRTQIEKEPIFIIGHWRSGTTHLHNILCQDPQMAYTTTFQSVFPDTLFNKAGRFLFEGFARILIPGTRKGDNVTLGTTLPQEEEFALGDKTPISFYYFWMFPRSLKKFYEQFVRFRNIDTAVIDSWKKDYKLLISKAMKNTGRDRFLSKNPPNTARIKVLLEMFPNARFIHIHRNPVEVYLSTHNFFDKMLPHLQLQSIEASVLDDHIFELYKNLMEDYLGQRELIPKGHLVELAFETLETNPKTCIRQIYKDLDLAGHDKSQPYFEAYLNKMKSYQKNKHRVTEALMKRIQNEWGFAMREWGYGVPSHIEIESNEAK
jgi:hypothetical protein